MQMRSGHPPRRADDADLLPSQHRVADCHRRLRQMEVSGDHPIAVVDVDDVSGKKEVVDQCHDTAIRRSHRIPGLPGEVDAAVTTGQSAIEESARPKSTRYA